MKGIGKTFSAVSIINAFATGLGSTMAIDLKTIAYVELKKMGIEGVILVDDKHFRDCRLIETVVKVFRDSRGRVSALNLS